MSAGSVINNLNQSLNCGGNCNCCSQVGNQQNQLSNQLNALSDRIAKIERYINKLDAAVTKFNDVLKDGGKAMVGIFKLISEMFIAGLLK